MHYALLEESVLLAFDGGPTATLIATLRCATPGQARVFGTDGWIDVLPRFHHPDTIVVHDSAWTATARHADFVLPCTMTLEREDIGGSSNDPLLVAMHKLAEPYGEAKDDYAIFAGLAERLGTEWDQ